MPERIFVIGAGGFGRETLDVLAAINSTAAGPLWAVGGVYDDNPAEANLHRLQALGVEYLGTTQDYQRHALGSCYVVAIGAPATRAKLANRFDALGARGAVLVHPQAVLGSRVSIGAGSVVCGGVQISTNVNLGSHVHVNPGATVGHDAIVGDFVSINPGAIISGDVRIERKSLIGAGAVVLQGKSVGNSSVVGASACVTRDVAPSAIVKGVPAQ